MGTVNLKKGKKSFGLNTALKDSLNETLLSTNEYTGQLRTELLSIKQIKLHPDNPRKLKITIEDCLSCNLEPLNINIVKDDKYYQQKAKEIEALAPLARSIRERGLINPILVYYDNDKYWLEAGERRVLATALLGKAVVPARIADVKPTSLELGLVHWDENNHRKDFTLSERIDNLNKIILEYCKKEKLQLENIRPREIILLLGVSKQSATMYYNVWRTDKKELNTLIEKVTTISLKKANFISMLKDQNMLDKVLILAEKGATLKEMQEAAAKYTKEQRNNIQKPRTAIVGKPANRVNLGATKSIKAVKYLVEVLKKNMEIPEDIEKLIEGTAWNNYRQVTQTFKALLCLLERQIY